MNERLDRCIDIALDNRKLEIDLVWKRTAVFWVFVAAIFVAVMTLRQRQDLRAAIALSLMGVVFSLIWTLANRGSKSWQESWELKAERFLQDRYGSIDIEVLGGRWERGGKRFATPYSGFVTLRPLKYSVSGLLVALSDFVVLFWVCFSLYTARAYLPVDLDAALARIGSPDGVGLMLVGALMYCAYVLIWCRSRRDPRDRRLER